jgi:hypothetical protein
MSGITTLDIKRAQQAVFVKVSYAFSPFLLIFTRDLSTIFFSKKKNDRDCEIGLRQPITLFSNFRLYSERGPRVVWLRYCSRGLTRRRGKDCVGKYAC